MLDDGMKDLNDLSRGLRGSGSKDVDSFGILSKVKDVTKSYLTSIQVIQGHYRAGNKDEAAAAIKATVGDTNVLLIASKNVNINSDIDFPVSSDITATSDGKPLALNDIPDAQLAEFIQPQVFDQIVEHAHDLVGILEDVDPSIFASTRTNHKASFSQKKPSQPEQGFKFDTDPFGFGFNSGHAHFQHQSHGQFHPSNFANHPSMQNIIRQHKSAHGSLKLSKLGSFFENDEIIAAKHQLRQDALGEDVCAEACEPEDWACNCNNLFTCVNDMTAYDLAVLIAGGYIDTGPSSDNFGQH